MRIAQSPFGQGDLRSAKRPLRLAATCIAAVVLIGGGIAICFMAHRSPRRLSLPSGGIFDESANGTCVVIPRANDDMVRRYRKDLEKLGDLSTLFLNGSDVTDAAIRELRGLTRLRMLNLSNTRITGSGLRDLACLKNLECLVLRGTAVTDSDVVLLERLSSLKYVDLSDTQITDTGLPPLARMRSLRSVDLFHTSVSEAGIESLRSVRPGLSISTGKAVRKR